jgi:hypothetical protein
VNVPAGRVEDRAGAGIGVQVSHDEIAAGAGGFRQQVYLVHDARIGDGRPAWQLQERRLDIYDNQCCAHASMLTCAGIQPEGTIAPRCGRIWSPAWQQHSHGWLCWSSPTAFLRAADADVHAWRVVDEWFAAWLRQPGRGD